MDVRYGPLPGRGKALEFAVSPLVAQAKRHSKRGACPHRSRFCLKWCISPLKLQDRPHFGSLRLPSSTGRPHLSCGVPSLPYVISRNSMCPLAIGPRLRELVACRRAGPSWPGPSVSGAPRERPHRLRCLSQQTRLGGRASLLSGRHCPPQVDVGKIEASLTRKTMFHEWRKHNANFRHTQSISSAYAEWTTSGGRRLVGCPQTPRVTDLLDTTWAMRIKDLGGHGHVTTTDAAKGFFADVGQAVQRRPWGGPRVLATTSVVYCYEFGFCFDGEDSSRLQGCPARSVPQGMMEDASKRRLAGESFSIPAMGTVLYAMYLNPWGVWWQS